MNSDAEIVERLNNQAVALRGTAAWERKQGRVGLANEIEIAANTIEQSADSITRLSARVEELERGLKPFADAALFLNGIAAKTPLMLPSYVDVEDHEVDATVGDLRKARSLLSPKKE